MCFKLVPVNDLWIQKHEKACKELQKYYVLEVNGAMLWNVMSEILALFVVNYDQNFVNYVCCGVQQEP